MKSAFNKAFNEKKFLEESQKYNKAKALSEKYLLDTDYVKAKVELFLEIGVLTNVDYTNKDIWNEDTETYTPHFALYLWREIALKALKYSYEEYRTFREIVKSLELLDGRL